MPGGHPDGQKSKIPPASSKIVVRSVRSHRVSLQPEGRFREQNHSPTGRYWCNAAKVGDDAPRLDWPQPP
jgi:hypothetical protein